MNWLTVKHPARAGVVCVFVALAVIAAALAVPKLILSLRTGEYHALVANATGLAPADTVNVAGVPSGVVTSMTVRGNTVDVGFRLDDGVVLGDRTSAEIKIYTLLGRRSLDIVPAGQGRMAPGSTIPLERTSVPFTLDDLGRGAENTTENLDLEQLRAMVETIGQVAPDDPELIGRSLEGITTVNEAVTRNSESIGALLSSAQATTQTLVDQKDTLVTLLGNAELLTSTLADRRAVIGSLIADINRLTTAASQFLGENQPLLDSVLTELDAVTAVLTENEQTLTTLLENFAPSVRYITNATGNGNWLDLNSPSTLIGDNWLCVSGLVQGCK
ncbi:MCE family protein [Rhodococcus sp. MTM3W5.2]|uniref:MCE family protein n=1 Tax=Rhodococcus sp. MTM3W5.2 TaxID=1805827 RepID=UPI00097C08ED|nr:MCE family protein [Rhodococcus sp. MTM3W5.2]